MADTEDSKSSALSGVRVQVPPRAPFHRGSASSASGPVGPQPQAPPRTRRLGSGWPATSPEAGFELSDLDRCYRTRGEELLANHRRGQPVWGDALYLRPPEAVLAFIDITADKIVRAAETMLGYGYTDVAEVTKPPAKVSRLGNISP